MTGATRLLAGAVVRGALRGEPARALPHLVIRAPGGAERAVALPDELTVGRGSEAGLVLEDGGASRLHARIRLAGDSATVEDLGSKNGLCLNGAPLRSAAAPLRPGDELLVGATVLRFEVPRSEGAVAAPPSTPADPSLGVAAGAAAPILLQPTSRLLALAAALLGLAAIALASG